MDVTVIEVAKQVPSLAVLAFVVWTFLRHMADSRAEFLSAIKEIQAENLEARSLMREVIKDNTSATRLVNESLVRLTEVVKHLETEAASILNSNRK